METSLSQFYIVSEMIKHRLDELLPQFSSEGIDHRLFEVAVKDFLNYLRWIWSIELDDWLSFEEKDEELNPNEKLRTLICQWIEYDAEQAREELDAWMSLWLVKWKERVKILFTDQYPLNQDTVQAQKLAVKGNELMGYQEQKQFYDPIVFTLISRGEIVGTEILSEVIVKREAGKLKAPPRELHDKIQFLNSCLLTARSFSLTPGKLIFVSVKNFNWRLETNG